MRERWCSTAANPVLCQLPRDDGSDGLSLENFDAIGGGEPAMRAPTDVSAVAPMAAVFRAGGSQARRC